MLQGIKKFAGKIFVNVLIGMLALSFAVWGIADVFRGHSSDVVAMVGKREITANQFSSAFELQVRALSRRIGQPVTPDDARQLGVDRQVLQGLLEDAALEEQATKLGISISDETVVNAVAKNPAYQDANGAFNPDNFRRVLQNAGYSEQRFVAEEKQQMLRNIMTANLGQDFAPATMVKMLWQQRNEQRDVQYFNIPASAITVAEPSDSEVKEYYQRFKSNFSVPEHRSITVVMATAEDVGKTITIDDAAVQEAYEQRKDSFATPEHRVLEQISYDSEGAANKAYEAIKAGQSFEDAAKARGLSDNDIHLGSYTQESFPDPSIVEKIFATPENQVTPPLKGQLATVLIRTTKLTPGTQKTLAQAKPEILKLLRNEMGRDQVAEIHDKVEDARAGGATLEDAAKELKLPIKKIAPFDSKGLDEKGNAVEVPAGSDLVKAAFASDVEVENDPLQTANEGYIWYEVKSVTPAQTKPFDDVKNEAIAGWKINKTRELLTKKAQDVVGDIKTASDFETSAKKYAAEIKAITGVKRNEATQELDTAAVSALYKVAPDGFTSALDNDGKAVKIIRSTPVMMQPYNAQGDDAVAIKKVLSNGLSFDMSTQYVRDVENELGVKVNDEVWSSITARSQ